MQTRLNEQQRMHFRLWLQKQFDLRRKRNPRYSLRSFAATLKSDASTLSQMLTGKRAPSKKAMLEICRRLAATPKDLNRMGAADSPEGQIHQLSADTFAVIAEWYHYALLELTFVRNFNPDPKWIASQLGISVSETHAALERLRRLGLLKDDGPTLKKTHEVISNHDGLNTSAARKSLQRQVVRKALAAIDEVPQENKDITSMTMAIDLKNLDRAREMIKKFRREICALLEEGQPAQVFHLGVQLYPVSKNSNQENL